MDSDGVFGGILASNIFLSELMSVMASKRDWTTRCDAFKRAFQGLPAKPVVNMGLQEYSFNDHLLSLSITSFRLRHTHNLLFFAMCSNSSIF